MVLVKLSSYLVQGILATSRALGDYPLKDQKLITAEPDVLHFDLAKVRAPRFAILAQLVAGLAPWISLTFVNISMEMCGKYEFLD